MPRLDPAMQSGKIIEWLKKQGDHVNQDEPVVRVEGEKTTFEVNSPGTGVVRRLMFEQGTDVQVGQILALVGEPNEPFPADLPVKEVTKPVVTEQALVVSKAVRAKQPVASPVARKMAREAGLDLSQIKGSGPGGRVVREDVLKAIEEAKKPARQVQVASQVRTVPITKTIKLSGKRRAVAERLSYGFHTTVPVTITMEVSTGKIIEQRRDLRDKTGEDISVTAYVVKAVAKALEEHPLLNSSLEQDVLQLYADINVAVAIGTPDGLVAPVIPHTNNKSVADISREIRILTERAIQNALSVPDVTGGTFTVSNLGGYGVELFAPVINPPQCAILGFGRTSEKPVVVGREVRPMAMTTLSLVFDHRIVDGVPAAQFLQRVKELLEDPARLT